MAKKPKVTGKGTVSSRPLRLLAERRRGRVSGAFRASVDKLRAGVDFDALVAAIRDGDVEAAVAACDIEDAAFSGLRQELRALYGEAGEAVAQAMPKPVKG